jgi:hypothetical protein
MSEQRYKVEVQGDHLARLASARPIQAIAELVWNGLDADATKVEVIAEAGDLGLKAVIVSDNGHGIPHEEAAGLFKKLGGSWKARGGVRSQNLGRMLHGQEGKGRFKALALGRVSDWQVTYANKGKLFRYTITLIRDDLVDVRISDPIQVRAATTGVEVRVSELHKDYRFVDSDEALQELSEIFALYLSDYPTVAIWLGTRKLDPAAAIAKRTPFKLDPIVDDGKAYDATLELIEWKSVTERVIYLCNEAGFPLLRSTPKLHAPGLQFSGT